MQDTNKADKDIDRKKKEKLKKDYYQCQDRLTTSSIVLCILICFLIYFITLINGVEFSLFLVIAIILYFIVISKIIYFILTDCYHFSRKEKIFENRLRDLEKLEK